MKLALEIAIRGGRETLDRADIRDFNEAQKRILRLMLDFEWHTATEIQEVAGTPGHPMPSGVRRLNDLKRIHGFDYEREVIPGSQRLWRYRLKEQREPQAVQVGLFGDKAA